MNLVLFTGLSCMHFGVFTKHVWVAGSTEPESVWLSLRQKITLGSLVILVCDSDFHFIWCKRNKYWRSTRKAFKNKEAKAKESTLSGSSRGMRVFRTETGQWWSCHGVQNWNSQGHGQPEGTSPSPLPSSGAQPQWFPEAAFSQKATRIPWKQMLT